MGYHFIYHREYALARNNNIKLEQKRRKKTEEI